MSKVISKDTSSGYRPWNAPEVGAGFGASAKVAKATSTRQLSPQIYDQLRKEAYAEGFQQGLAAGNTELQARVRHLQQVMQGLANPFQDLDDQVENELVTLAMTLGRFLVRRELRENPEEIVPVVREAMAALPVAARNIRLQLHPDDAKLVREALALESQEVIWTLEEEISLSRGGCRVVTDSSTVDATLESRLSAVIAQMMGGEREDDNELDPAN